MAGTIPNNFFTATPGTHTAQAILKLSRIYETGKLRNLDQPNFKNIEHAVFSLLREGKAEIYISNTGAVRWFKQCGFKPALKKDVFLIQENSAKVPDYDEKIENYFASEMFKRYKHLSASEKHDPLASLQAANAVLAPLNENIKNDIIRILKRKGATSPLATINVLDGLMNTYAHRRNNESTLHEKSVTANEISE
jgi:hypothetical protein